MKPGLYEQLLNRATARQLEQLEPGLEAFTRRVGRAEAPTTLTRDLLKVLERALNSVQTRVDTVNQILFQLIEMVQRGAVDHTDLLEPELRELLAVVRKTGLAQVTPGRPSLPLNVTDLPARPYFHPGDPLGDVPLMVHCRYNQAEILAAFGILTKERPHLIREGVYHHKPGSTDLVFITIRKSEKDYSPTNMYQDYALSPELFHWQSQSTTRAESDNGKLYRSASRKLLFVREAAKDANDLTMAYVCLGPAQYVSHEGERPMNIVWKLEHSIPTQFYRWMRLAT